MACPTARSRSDLQRERQLEGSWVRPVWWAELAGRVRFEVSVGATGIGRAPMDRNQVPHPGPASRSQSATVQPKTGLARVGRASWASE